MQSKPALRRASATARRARDAGQLATARAAIRDRVLAALADSGWQVVAAYEPLRSEPGSTDLLAALHTRVRVLVPITLADNDLDWAQWSPQGRGPALGRHAVGTADAVLVPASAVSPRGVRLGRGGGSYDRALPRTRPGTTLAAVVFDDEIVDDVPADPWDVPVTAYVSPSGWTDVPPA